MKSVVVSIIKQIPFLYAFFFSMNQRKIRRKWKKKVKFNGRNWQLDDRTVFEGRSAINSYCKLLNTFIGHGTYIASGSFLKNVNIGRYCSIGENVTTICGNHPKEFVSTHPAFYSLNTQAGFTYSDNEYFEEFKYIDSENKKSVYIGNDVWIGSYVRILERVSIGDGAIVAAGAIVTHDIPPYAIVAGVPARIVKYRFDESTVQKLLNFSWWEKDEEWMKKYAKLFIDVNDFLKVVDNE